MSSRCQNSCFHDYSEHFVYGAIPIYSDSQKQSPIISFLGGLYTYSNYIYMYINMQSHTVAQVRKKLGFRKEFLFIQQINFKERRKKSVPEDLKFGLHAMVTCGYVRDSLLVFQWLEENFPLPSTRTSYCATSASFLLLRVHLVPLLPCVPILIRSKLTFYQLL